MPRSRRISEEFNSIFFFQNCIVPFKFKNEACNPNHTFFQGMYIFPKGCGEHVTICHHVSIFFLNSLHQVTELGQVVLLFYYAVGKKYDMLNHSFVIHMKMRPIKVVMIQGVTESSSSLSYALQRAVKIVLTALLFIFRITDCTDRCCTFGYHVLA